MIDWKPISTMPFGVRVMLFFEHGEKGNGEIDTNVVYPENEHDPSGPWSYWTWGGPNSGSDFERDEKPVLWADPEPLLAGAIEALRATTPTARTNPDFKMDFKTASEAWEKPL